MGEARLGSSRERFPVDGNQAEVRMETEQPLEIIQE
jgi:hypothetical protein